jgi:hypothetical protein
MSDPKRLLDDDIDPSLRAALDAGRREAPSEQRLDAILARLPTEPSGGGGGGGGAGAAAKPMGALAKVAMGLGAAALVGGAALLLFPSPPTPAVVPPPASTPMLIASAQATTAPPASLETAVPSPSVARPVPTHAVPSSPASVVAPPPDPALEVSLLQDAHDALATAPATALAKCAEQERLFPSSSVAQEREVIAIDALLRLHRDAEAKARAAAFSARFPGSASQRRVDALLGQ